MNCSSCQAENDEHARACARCGAELVAQTGADVAAQTGIVVTVDLRPGSVFHGRYEIVGPLGRGGMGMVYKARDRSLDETVAIKVLRPEFVEDPRMAERFKSEIKLARRVRHRNVCAIHDYGEDRGLLYISMELVEGQDLKRVLREKGGLPPDEAYEVAIQVAEGLQAVHDAGIIHRDLKTPNIMRDAQGVTRLMDFGIAKRQGEGTLTATGHIVGTPEYMSPEQAQGLKVDFRSDVYALGVVTYEIFTGAVPFRGETPISTILKQLNDPPPLDGPAAARIPPDLKPVLKRCLAKDPAQRYATARELAEALRLARSPSRRQQPISTDVLQAPTLVRPAEPAAQSTRELRAAAARRSRFVQPWLLAVPALAIGAGVWMAVQGRPTARPLDPPDAAPSSPALVAAASAPAATHGGEAQLVAPVTMAPAPSSVAAAAPAAATAPSPAKRSASPTPRPAALPSRAPAAAPTAPPATTPASLPSSAPPTTLPAPAATPAAPAAAQDPGQLQVAVRPWGEVSVDGRVIGTTPLDRIPLAAGPHMLRVKHPAYEVWERQVVIRPGQIERVVVDLAGAGARKQ
jgi:hypothetical protein